MLKYANFLILLAVLFTVPELYPLWDQILYTVLSIGEN